MLLGWQHYCWAVEHIAACMCMRARDRSTVANLNHKTNTLQTEAVLLREELAAANSNLLQQQHENSSLRTENSALLDGHRRQMQVHSTSYCRTLTKQLHLVCAAVTVDIESHFESSHGSICYCWEWLWTFRRSSPSCGANLPLASKRSWLIFQSTIR